MREIDASVFEPRKQTADPEGNANSMRRGLGGGRLPGEQRCEAAWELERT
jgi:hypothetical protein